MVPGSFNNYSNNNHNDQFFGGIGNIGGIPGTDSAGIGLAGSSYLRGLNNNQFNESKEDENWDEESQESEAEDYGDCEERGEFIFENRARYKGQWKGNMRHGYGI